MDRLAANGGRFTDMFVTTSICAASRASLLTGLHEHTHRYTFGCPPISNAHAAHSYPARLRRAGYRTGFVGKFGVKIEPGGTGDRFDCAKILSRNPCFKKQPDGSTRHVSEIAGDRAVDSLRSCKGDRPFFLSVGVNAPPAEDLDKRDHYPSARGVDGLYGNVTIPSPRLSRPEIFQSQPEFLRKSLNRQHWFWRWDTPENTAAT